MGPIQGQNFARARRRDRGIFMINIFAGPADIFNRYFNWELT